MPEGSPFLAESWPLKLLPLSFQRESWNNLDMDKEGFQAGMAPPVGELSMKVIRANGTVEDLGVVSTDVPKFVMTTKEVPRWAQLVVGFLTIVLIAGLFFVLYSLFRKLFFSLFLCLPVFGLVTNAGVNYMAADFLATSTNHIAAFNQHDNGTGTNAAAITDTTLQTPTGGARVAGTQSNPSSNQYRSVATISFSSGFAITEWGIFSAASVGTLWDRRVFSAVNVVNGDSIQYTYTLTVNSGGS